jgi:diaminohydroxyphosphoribosylaminopyrimidine deaminase/5-amino-6-(5-phosphoribosylamino)uracil reductase
VKIDAQASPETWMKLALRLAKRGLGTTSPNPMVGAVLLKGGKMIGSGWHRRAGCAHAEVEAIQDALAKGHNPRGATLFVSLEPCSTHGRTPPCTDLILGSGIKRVVCAATDPNPAHAGKGFEILRQAGVDVVAGVLAAEASRLNEAFNFWIQSRLPFVTLKCGMTLDGKIATKQGESKWITGEQARAQAMFLREGADAILVGINTAILDDPALTIRTPRKRVRPIRRLVLDSDARIPLTARLLNDEQSASTTIVVGSNAPIRRVRALEKKVSVWKSPESGKGVDLEWLLGTLGAAEVTHLLVEGGGEVAYSFLEAKSVHRTVFFYAPKVLGGRSARTAVAGDDSFPTGLRLGGVEWKKVGLDLMLSGLVQY